ELARTITLENGKMLAEARAELRRAIENVEVACGIPTLMQGYNLEDVARGIDEMMIRQPLGVAAAITPFNFPAMIPFWFLPYAIAATHGKRMQCQGGAKNFVVIMPDADLEAATSVVADSAFGCAGQRCLAVSVAVTVAESQTTFRDSAARTAAGLRVGSGLDEHNQRGPVISAESKQRVETLIRQGAEEGGGITVHGRNPLLAAAGNFSSRKVIDQYPPV